MILSNPYMYLSMGIIFNILKLDNKAANAVSVKEIFICERSRHEKQTKK